jgi:hypothetical protein
MLDYVGPAHPRPTAFVGILAFNPSAERSNPRFRHERTDISHPFGVSRIKSGRPAIDIELDSHNRPNPLPLALEHEPRNSTEIGGVGYTYSMEAELGGSLRQRLGGEGAIVERKGGVASELDERHGHQS